MSKPFDNCRLCNSPYLHGHNAVTDAYEPYIDGAHHVRTTEDGHTVISVEGRNRIRYSHAPSCKGCER